MSVTSAVGEGRQLAWQGPALLAYHHKMFRDSVSYLEQLRAHVDGCSYCEATCRGSPQAKAPGAGVSLLQIAAALKTSCIQASFVHNILPVLRLPGPQSAQEGSSAAGQSHEQAQGCEAVTFQDSNPDIPNLIRTTCSAVMVACFHGMRKVAALQKADHMLSGTTHAQEKVLYTVEYEMG